MSLTHDGLGGFGSINPDDTKIICNPDHAMVWSEAPTNLTVTSVAIYTPSIYDFDGGHLNLKSFIGSYNDTDVRKIIAACSNSEKIDDKFNAYVLQRMFEITASNRMASSTMALTDAQKEEINEIGNSEYQFLIAHGTHPPMS